MVRLPFASPPVSLGDTRKSAERLLAAMERRCSTDPQFGSLYHEFLKEYEKLSHMDLVIDDPNSPTRKKCYLPHHGVLREARASAKLRVVFNGSQRVGSGESLNSQLLIGANLLPPLADVLMRWRWHRFVIATDIEKMYRQILVSPEDRDFQRILWRQSSNDPIREYRLNTVTYGLACAPFLAIRTFHQLADDEKSRFPSGAAVLRRDCYVDDIVTGASSISDAVVLQNELRQLCMAGGFPLRKWSANHPDLLTEIPSDHRLVADSLSWKHEGHATLGLHWYPNEDAFSFFIKPRSLAKYTKRTVLAETVRLFDPLGWLAPVVIRAKILIQSTWLHLDWDAQLLLADVLQWQLFLEELPQLARLRVKRWICGDIEDSRLELHGFADASERGYAAVAYLRVLQADSAKVHLLMAKSKVAPIKPVSFPRLELCAASLLANLINHVRTTLNLSIAPVTVWSDSKVTLHWIQGHASRWKTYVANRVSLIQELLPNASWRHVPGKDNPADCASRGIPPGDLISHPLWWSGPAWLSKDESEWPGDSWEVPAGDLPDQRANSHAASAKVITEPEILTRFSTLHRLLRVTAWCLRWRQLAGRVALPGRAGGLLSLDDLNRALLLWLRVTQGLHYSAEVASVRSDRALPRQSRLVNLSPFLDDNRVFRVQGRLKHAALSPDERHPMIVAPHSHLARLLVESHHRRTLHGGVQLTLASLRLHFWIPQGRAVVKRLLHRCVTCARWRAVTPQPPMGNLPRGRVTPARPFLHTGVDYAGPIFVRTTKGRGHRAHKAYIAIFICLSSKAVHIEVVSDYTSEAFLAALRRFTSRRGLCTDLYSDCGTNFSGADKQLRDLFRASSPDGQRIADAVTSERIRWHFNPPAAPHFGGLWEAAVKSTKHHLRRVIGDTTLTYEEMSTFLTQVEACLNSRPLHPLSDDPDDVSALTPGHLLIGAPLIAIPEPSLAEKSRSSLSRWRLLQQMRDHFWQRWSSEYLHALASRPKWHSPSAPLQVGSLCLIRSETPPTKWPLARITKLHPGKDGIPRVATVRTASSEFLRPLVKLVPLPVDTADAASSETLEQ